MSVSDTGMMEVNISYDSPIYIGQNHMSSPLVLKGWEQSPSVELGFMLVEIIFKFRPVFTDEIPEKLATLQLYQHEDTAYGRLALDDAIGACIGSCDTSAALTFYIIQSNNVKTALSFSGKPLRSMQFLQSKTSYVCDVIAQAPKGTHKPT